MKVDFSAVLLQLNGKDAIKDIDTKDCTLGGVACGALLAPFPDEANLDPKEKVRRFKLAMKASDGGEQELSVEDVGELKTLIGKAYPPLIVGRAFEILDPEAA